MIPIRYNVRSLIVRRTTSIATLVGVALVVGVIAGAMMLVAGLDQALKLAGAPDHVLILRKGSDAELASGFETTSLGMIFAGPGVKRDSAGKPIGAGEIVTVILGEKVGSEGDVSNVLVRGVADNVMAIRPSTRIIEGRAAQPGTDEAIVGRQIAGRFKGIALNGKVELKKNRPITIVGVFEAGGSSFESEVWADIETVRTSFGREGHVTSATVVLDSPTKYDAYKTAIEQDKRLALEVIREPTYYEKQSEATGTFLTVLGVIISTFFVVAAVIGAFITMNTAVAHRQREIGTMRALGFSRMAVMTSFTIECVLLSLTGAAIGMFLASLLTFVKFPIVNFATWSEMVFAFRLTPAIAFKAVVWGGVMGLVGGLIPAFRAARMRPIDAFRA